MIRKKEKGKGKSECVILRPPQNAFWHSRRQKEGRRKKRKKAVPRKASLLNF
jgi:hypothetical protein